VTPPRPDGAGGPGRAGPAADAATDGSGADADPDRADAAQSFYDRWAVGYDALASAPGVRRVRADAVDLLAPDPGDVVVDVGCGTGATLPHLRERVGPSGTVVGVDFAPGVLARARERVESRGWSNVHVVRGDAERPPVGRADAVVASFVVGMLSAPAAAVRTWGDLLGPGGRLCLFDLARSTGVGRPLNRPFAALVAGTSPPGTDARYRESPADVLDRRVAAAHRALLARCEPATHRTRALGFVRLSAGTVR
jgi:ubiquinone/menaquinone biosynthesis C-methylase UbiE